MNYVYDGANLVAEVDSLGNTMAAYAQGAGIDEPLAMSRAGVTSYYQADGLGSVTSLANAAGVVSATYTYDAFGNLTNSAGDIVNPFRYTGREWDQETGLYYYRARYYDATTGRFLSEDPIGFDSGQDSFYGYVGNSPVSNSDPAGLAPLGLPNIPESLYKRCATQAFGSCKGNIPGSDRSIPSNDAITLVLGASLMAGVDPAVVAATMAIESNSNLKIGANLNDNGSLDIGPMQLNSYYAGKPGGYVAYPGALGTNPTAGDAFNGDPFANILSGASFLRRLGKHPEKYVGRDPRRKRHLGRLVPPMNKLFNCLLKGLGLM